MPSVQRVPQVGLWISVDWPADRIECVTKALCEGIDRAQPVASFVRRGVRRRRDESFEAWIPPQRIEHWV